MTLIMVKLKKFWLKHKRYKIRQELMSFKSTPEMRERAKKIMEANAEFRKLLDNCGWYFGGVQNTHLRRWGRTI